MRNPDWVRDEIILAMDLYFRAGRKLLPANHADVIRLSQLLSDQSTSSEDDAFPEGELLTRLHTSRERNRAAVEKKKTQLLARFGRLECEACGFEFQEVYGELGRGFAECHHILPLAEAVFVRATRLSDLAIVCANCHRMLHRACPQMIVAVLRSHLSQRRGQSDPSVDTSHAIANLSR
jgi:5-methylcytosine-specific restriction protein A